MKVKKCVHGAWLISIGGREGVHVHVHIHMNVG